ncbi:MAG: S-methyl-5-thioribose-1-phosphate isomerase [Bacteroidetes bacterium]|nr:S-methyl-5-thioribose-1-phosphate isomerase [Bacteroidota bacterium]
MNDTITVISLTPSGLRFLDQTRLPRETIMIDTADYRIVIEAIRSLRLRGAPLIGIAAAYGLTLAAREWINTEQSDYDLFYDSMCSVCDAFAATRPTAVNLFWTLGRMRKLLGRRQSPETLTTVLEEEARALHADDARRCTAIGRHGVTLIPPHAGVITHCNTGALATGGDGTAFAVLLAAHRQGRDIHVFADETRPLLQGARLTMWELLRHGIPATLITDGTAAMLMRQGRVQVAITGADRIAANGDTANKIGTYALAVNAQHHGIPFYIAAPLSTMDMTLQSGDAIPIEERAGEEITRIGDTWIAPEGIDTYTPAFDVTPSELITGFITERGLLTPPFTETLHDPHP